MTQCRRKGLGKGKKRKKGKMLLLRWLTELDALMLPTTQDMEQDQAYISTYRLAAGQRTYIKREWVQGVGRKGDDLTRLKQLRKPRFWDEHSAWRWLLAWSHILEVPHGNTSCSCWVLPSPKSSSSFLGFSSWQHCCPSSLTEGTSSELRRWSGWRR